MSQALRLYVTLCLLGITTCLVLSKLPELCAIAILTGISGLVLFGDFINHKESPKRDLDNELYEGTGHD